MKEFPICDSPIEHPQLVVRVTQDLEQLPLDQVADMLKAIAEVNRTKIVAALGRHGEICVCDLAAILNLSIANTSSHLRKLYKVGIIKNRREGKQVYYSLDDDHVNQIIAMSIAHKEEG